MDGAQKTIVVADDEDFLRLLVRETLRSHQVLEASDGDQALAVVREAMPDLLILDWMMPGRDGPAVLQALRGDDATRDIPVLMVTAKCAAAERERLIALGATACLAKPFGPAELRARVDELLAKSGTGRA